jgi:hypothetical protein
VVSDVVEGADKSAKSAKAKKAAKKKAEPLNTNAVFKKLDGNGDGKLDLAEFKKIYTVRPEPKGKKGKAPEPVDLEVAYKSLDANGDKTLSATEFTGIIGAVFPPPKK